MLPFTRYGLKAPGVFQYLNPSLLGCEGPPPKKRTMPTIIRPTMVISLIEANQNSDSPKKGTAMMFRRRIVTRMMVIQTAGLMSAFFFEGQSMLVKWFYR